MTLTMELCGGYMFFCGLIEIARELHTERALARVMSFPLKKLMPNIHGTEAEGAVVMNIAMNMMGMGNASTPVGLEAMKKMATERALRPQVKHDMEMMLILNATSLQLIPTTVLALRTAAGSVNSNVILIPTILCSALATAAGVCCGMLCKWLERRKNGH